MVQQVLSLDSLVEVLQALPNRPNHRLPAALHMEQQELVDLFLELLQLQEEETLLQVGWAVLAEWVVWGEELEQWALWEVQAISLLLLLKVQLDLLLVAFLLVPLVLEVLLLVVLHNLDKWVEELLELLDFLVQAHRLVVLLLLTIPIISHSILLK